MIEEINKEDKMAALRAALSSTKAEKSPEKMSGFDKFNLQLNKEIDKKRKLGWSKRRVERHMKAKFGVAINLG